MADSRSYPKDGKVFKLTLDGDAPENQPLAMVRDIPESKGWRWWHQGPVIKRRETRYFKLVKIGSFRVLQDVRRMLAIHGRVPEGQWREAFKTSFPKHDGKGPVGVADASWKGPLCVPCFPCIDEDGDSGFDWMYAGFSDDWRWLVEVNEK